MRIPWTGQFWMLITLITVAGVEAGRVALRGPGLQGQRHQPGELPARDVEHRDGAGLLQREVRGRGAGLHGDVLRLQVARDRSGLGLADRLVDVRAEDPHALRQGVVLEVGEACRPHVVLSEREPLRDVDEADRPLRVGAEVVRRLALVRDQHGVAIRAEGQHVRQRADTDGGQRSQVAGVEEGDPPWLHLVVVLHRDGQHAIADVDRVDVARADPAAVHSPWPVEPDRAGSCSTISAPRHRRRRCHW